VCASSCVNSVQVVFRNSAVCSFGFSRSGIIVFSRNDKAPPVGEAPGGALVGSAGYSTGPMLTGSVGAWHGVATRLDR
jgi:hypothetical protein